MTTALEAAFATLWRQLGGPEPEAAEYRFAPPRRYRFDFAWPSVMVAVECEGGTWTAGAHTRGRHFTSDCRKYNLAASLGWRVFRVTTDMLREEPVEALGPILATVTQAVHE